MLDVKAKRVSSTGVLTIMLYCILFAVAVVYIAPLLWMLSVALKSNAEVFASPFSLPESLKWENFAIAWSVGRLGKATLNSIVVCGVSLFVSMFFGSLAAFPISRMKWKLSGTTLSYFLVGMMVPVHCVLIPLFVTLSKISLTDNAVGLILPYVAFALPLTIYLLAGFFSSMPSELFESACVDGCSIYGTFFRIALPLAKSGLFVAGLMTFVANWNELLLALVFMSNPERKTLPVTVSYFVSPYSTNYVQMFAAIIIAVLPTIVVYSCFSNQIVEGLTAGAMKS